MKTKLGLVILFFISFLKSICFSECPATGTTIFFGNGVFTSKQDAREKDLGDLNPKGLKPQLKLRLSQTNSPIQFDCLKFDLAYNSKEAFKLDLLEAASQVIGEDTSKFWRLLSNLKTAPSAFKKFASKESSMPTETSYATDADLRAQVTRYLAEKNAGNKIIVVAHSQGNLYANAAYSYIYGSPVVDGSNTFSIVSVASPSDYVSGLTEPYIHTTLQEDGVINSFLLKHFFLPANITNLPTYNCGNPIDCHLFVDSYLSGPFSRNKILDQIISEVAGYDLSKPAPFVQITQTSFPSQNMSPAISNDGSTIAFVSNANIDGLNSELVQSLFVTKNGGLSFSRIAKNLFYDVTSLPPSLNGDGSLIVFMARATTFDNAGIYISNTNDTGLKQLTTKGNVGGAVLSSDGSTVVYSSFPTGSDNQKIYAVNSDNSNSRTVVEFCCGTSGIGSSLPAISGKGDKISFMFSRGLVQPLTADLPSFRIGVKNTTDDSFTEISPNLNQVYSQTISDDGSAIATVSFFNPSSVFVANSNGNNGNTTNLPYFIGTQPIALTNDGSYLLYDGSGNLYLAAINDLAKAKQITFNFDSASPAMNGNGKRVVFLSNSDLAGHNADKNLEVFLANIQ